MRILWLADGGVSTGFSRVTASLAGRLVRDYGHSIHVLASNHRGDPWAAAPCLKLYPADPMLAGDLFGRMRIPTLLPAIEPDLVFINNDPNVVLYLLFDNEFDRGHVLLGSHPLAYVPVDGYDLPRAWSEVLPKAANVIAYSKFGEAAIPSIGQIYHGVDVESFHPVGYNAPITMSDGRVLRSKAECKQAFGWDSQSFVVLRVDSNSGRKDYPASWKALVPFLKRHSDALVHFHCSSTGPQVGVVLPALFSRDQETKSRFSTPDRYDRTEGWPESDLVALYNAADVFLSTSRGEGFGFGLAEAAACGIPVVAQNVTAIPEVVGPGGVLLEPRGRVTVPAGQDLCLPDIEAFTDALERLYRSRGMRRDLGAAGREHVVNSFSWDVSAESLNGIFTARQANQEVLAAIG